MEVLSYGNVTMVIYLYIHFLRHGISIPNSPKYTHLNFKSSVTYLYSQSVYFPVSFSFVLLLCLFFLCLCFGACLLHCLIACLFASVFTCFSYVDTILMTVCVLTQPFHCLFVSRFFLCRRTNS